MRRTKAQTKGYFVLHKHASRKWMINGIHGYPSFIGSNRQAQLRLNELNDTEMQAIQRI